MLSLGLMETQCAAGPVDGRCYKMQDDGGRRLNCESPRAHLISAPHG